MEYLSLYSIKLYIGITKSMSLALSISVLFVSLMQSVNGAQHLIIIFFLLFGTVAVPAFATVIVPLTSMYALL